MKQSINRSQRQGTMHCFLFDPSVYITVRASLEGKLTAEEIKKAVEKAYTQNETTMSKVVLQNGSVFFENLSGTGCQVFIEQRDWQEIMHENERSVFRINEGELVRSFIIPQEKGYTLFVMAHHIMGDGKSLIMLLEDIFGNLEGKEAVFRPLNKEGMDKFPPKLKLPFVSRVGMNLLNLLWRKKQKIFTWEDYYNIHEKFWNLRQSDIQFESIEKEDFHAIKAECKRLGITINSYMVTKILQKHQEYENVCCSASIRGTNRSFSNLVVLTRANCRYYNKKTFEENAKEIHCKIRQRLEDSRKKYFIALCLGKIEPTLLDSSLMYTYAGYQNNISKLVANMFGYAGENKTHLSVTNLQNVGFKSNYEGFRLKDVAFTAACMSATKNVVCVSTFQDKMTISYSGLKNRNQVYK